MLHGREAERERVAGLIEAAREGQGGAIVLRGEPGIGKSALLAAAGELGEGMQVLSARGVESESELPFAGLSALASPVLDQLEQVPSPQRSALESALSLGPPVPSDRFAPYAATLGLMAAASERRPLLVLVDDAQWLDAASAEALHFSSRRLGEDRVAVLFALRGDERAADDLSDLPSLVLEGLDLEACRTLLEDAAECSVAGPVAERLGEATGGNPLALTELPRLLTREQLEGVEPLPVPLPLEGSLAELHKRRIAGLGHDAQRALTVVATSESGQVRELETALAALGLSLRSLEPAEDAGLVAISSRKVEFQHPLLRSTAYQAATVSERRAAHGALAKALPDASFTARAWHRAGAVVGFDEEAALDMEAAASDARSRGAPAAAASAMEASARLTREPGRRVRRLMQSGADAYLAGHATHAARVLERAGAEAEGVERAEIKHLRGRVEMFAGTTRAARELLLAAAEEVEPIDPANAVIMLAEAEGTLIMEGRAEAARVAAERAYRLGKELGGPPGMVGALVLGGALGCCGQPERSRRLVEAAEPLISAGGLAESVWLTASYALALCWLEEEPRAATTIRRIVRRARTEGAVGLLPFALAVESEVSFRLGRWSEAYAAASESVRLGLETGERSPPLASLVVLARIDAYQGREEDCRVNAQRAVESAAVTGAGSIRHTAHTALGRLELGLGRPDQAIPHLELVQRLTQESELSQPTVCQDEPDLIEAYARAGRHEDAEQALAEFERRRKSTAGPWLPATAARCRGLLASADDFHSHFEQALELHEHEQRPFELARTQLCFGERLRRAKRRSEARPWLRRALDAFDRMGAVPWSAKAQRELKATGERMGPRSSSKSRALTPQEFQVALLVAEGASNRETATALFVSPRTVEAHLNRIYRKLDISSRSQLTRLVVEGRLESLEEPCVR